MTLLQRFGLALMYFSLLILLAITLFSLEILLNETMKNWIYVGMLAGFAGVGFLLPDNHHVELTASDSENNQHSDDIAKVIADLDLLTQTRIDERNRYILVAACIKCAGNESETCKVAHLINSAWYQYPPVIRKV